MRKKEEVIKHKNKNKKVLWHENIAKNKDVRMKGLQ